MIEEKDMQVISAALDETDIDNMNLAKEMTAIKSTSDLIRFSLKFLIENFKVKN